MSQEATQGKPSQIEHPAPHPKSFSIQIDRTTYEVSSKKMTGSDLRAVPKPPIGTDRDLYEIRPNGEDKPIGNQDVVEIKDGLRFFTAPSRINPGDHR